MASRKKVPLSDPDRYREVLTAARAVLAEVGYERFNMDLVARRVQASKATLYQRWPSKAALIIDAIHTYQARPDCPDTGSLVEDFRFLGRWAVTQTNADTRGLVIGLLEGSRRDEELARLYLERMQQGGPDLAQLVVQRAAERGELAPDVDLEILQDLIGALYLFQLLVRGVPPDEQLIDRVADGIIGPLSTKRATTAAQQSQGNPP
ncbi:TetR/AcrR family transcriptional regulator [Crossiella sp. CA-258035]|uniref:TetR/AcrR family transcriptional regulator n=1 Tax=Crossiella sp. CA-258035 TaxID=2981138 RepID=UPI0024BBFB53|nr:TetR/AcrR family transcriptional regulator [Crossiella sp. CA-258035]WHT21088.1 TetR/AcrR family transcriptional regulator [Crossiella sp. CA-258035]